MNRPSIDKAPGLAWRKRADGWVATWVARQDIVKKGYSPSTQRLKLFTATPTDDEARYIQSECLRLQDEMLAFGSGGTKPSFAFDGTIKGLVDAYQRDPDSPFHKLRHSSKKHYLFCLRKIETMAGARALHAIGARDFKRWYEFWRGGKDGSKVSTAHDCITMLRTMLKYGIAFEVEQTAGFNTAHCARLKGILSEMQFENSPARTATLGRVECEAICAAANAAGLSSVALAQALQFELTLRQRDVIGEWVPLSEPGISDTTHHGEKWLRGIRWEEIDENMILRHQMSKSKTVKILEFDLKLYPLVCAELSRIKGDKRVGPIVVCELTRKPWKHNHFRIKWREIAISAGIPKTVRNMDSRAGGTTETIRASGGNLEAARKQAGHSDVRMTQRYSRNLLESNSEVAVLRARKTNDERGDKR